MVGMQRVKIGGKRTWGHGEMGHGEVCSAACCGDRWQLNGRRKRKLSFVKKGAFPNLPGNAPFTRLLGYGPNKD